MPNSTVDEIRSALAALEDPKARAVNERHGDAHGVNLSKLRSVAKSAGMSTDLARSLWATDEVAAQLVALLVAKPRELSADEIDGYAIPARSGVMVSAYVTHRHPAFWRDPERFDPDRFLPENSANRPRFAYFPFGGGPRLCIGNEFALMEAQILLAMIMQRYRVDVAPGHTVEHEIRVTLRPKQPMRMVVRPA